MQVADDDDDPADGVVAVLEHVYGVLCIRICVLLCPSEEDAATLVQSLRAYPHLFPAVHVPDVDAAAAVNTLHHRLLVMSPGTLREIANVDASGDGLVCETSVLVFAGCSEEDCSEVRSLLTGRWRQHTQPGDAPRCVFRLGSCT